MAWECVTYADIYIVFVYCLFRTVLCIMPLVKCNIIVLNCSAQSHTCKLIFKRELKVMCIHSFDCESLL